MQSSEPTGRDHAVRRDERALLLKRLSRIRGQVEGISRMVAEDRYCVDVLTQIAAVRSALDSLGLKLLRDHAHGCVREAVRSGDGEQALDELMEVARRLIR